MILGNYFKENKPAAQGAEDATDVIGWILNHQRVRSILDETQAEKNNGKVLTYLVANLTCWTTHFIAFARLNLLKPALCQAVILRRDDIVAAQVGAEKKTCERTKHTQMANRMCDLLDSSGFWNVLQTIIDDIEPICFGTNINQSDNVQPDQALLSLAGIYLHFDQHSDRQVADGMRKRIEKRWKALDQPMFVFALILNAYEKLDRFGGNAAVSVFSLNTVFIEVSSPSSVTDLSPLTCRSSTSALSLGLYHGL